MTQCEPSCTDTVCKAMSYITYHGWWFHVVSDIALMWVKHGKTLSEIIPSHGWCMALFYPHCYDYDVRASIRSRLRCVECQGQQRDATTQPAGGASQKGKTQSLSRFNMAKKVRYMDIYMLHMVY